MLWNVELRQEPPSLKTEFPQHLVGTLNYHRDGRQTYAVEHFEKWAPNQGVGHVAPWHS
jgi:hypothetical protein